MKFEKHNPEGMERGKQGVTFLIEFRKANGLPQLLTVKHLPANAGNRGSISGSERSLGEMAIYSSSLAWEIS